MNGKRCAIRLGKAADSWYNYDDWCYVKRRGPEPTIITSRACIFGSHSEAKRELKKWLPAWPDAKIVEEMDL